MSEDEELHLIPVTWIKQYYFCPRIVYFLGVTSYRERLTESMVKGKEFHVDEERRSHRRKTLGGERREAIKSCLTRLSVSSTRLGLYGTIDEVAETKNGLVVVENKLAKAPKKPPPGHVYQATAYAMLAEEALGKPVRKVLLRYLYDNKSIELPVTEDMKKHVLWVTSRIRLIVDNEKIPRAAGKGRCQNCGFRKTCIGT